ncbi:hypothetical protein Q3G72_015647 [Acer saccharum]|nr:hypothetical protein Q3G72_015647 [Acer saccharum]
MADVDPEVATAVQTTNRTLKKFSFRGVDLDTLLDSVLISLSSSSPHVLALDSDLPLSCLIKHLNLARFIYTESYCAKVDFVFIFVKPLLLQDLLRQDGDD